MMLLNFGIIRMLACFTFLPGLTIYLIRQWAQGGQFRKDDIRIDDKVVIITGGNSGIGRETAFDLAKRGARVYLASRNLEKSEKVKRDIINQTENANIFVTKLDLASFESIQEFVEEFKKNETKLHILVNNAGVALIQERQTTKDGLELQMGINHFGHFLLTKLLLDTIKNAAPARIINVSSLAHVLGTIDRDDLQMEKFYFRWSAYGQSKLANILFSRELAKRLQGTNVTVNSLHPGIVDTDIYDGINFIDRLLFPPRIFMKTPKSGAQTQIMLAVDPDLVNVSGRYFADCAIASESSEAQSDETAAWLWQESERVTQPFLDKS